MIEFSDQQRAVVEDWLKIAFAAGWEVATGVHPRVEPTFDWDGNVPLLRGLYMAFKREGE